MKLIERFVRLLEWLLVVLFCGAPFYLLYILIEGVIDGKYEGTARLGSVFGAWVVASAVLFAVANAFVSDIRNR